MSSINNCVMASFADSYDYWLGNVSSISSQQNATSYQTASTNDLKYGW